MKGVPTVVQTLVLAGTLLSALLTATISQGAAAMAQHLTPVASATGVKQGAPKPGGSAVLLQAVLDSMPDIVFAKDLEGRYIAGNAAWARLVGKPLSTLIGQRDGDLFPAELAAGFRRCG